MMNKIFKTIAPGLVLILSCLGTIASHATVFSIVPRTTLPTSVTQNRNATAYYTVTNTTGSFHSGNYVKYLPSNVTQVTVDNTVPNLCGATFALAPNASCILELNITGAVNGGNPNPREHLFVCLGGCVTCCAGTNYPLNVTQNAAVYTAIFDAGSSGTRLSFYQVLPGTSDNSPSFFNIAPNNSGYPIIEKIATFDDSLTNVPNDDGINDFLQGNGTLTLAPGESLPPGCPSVSNLERRMI